MFKSFLRRASTFSKMESTLKFFLKAEDKWWTPNAHSDSHFCMSHDICRSTAGNVHTKQKFPSFAQTWFRAGTGSNTNIRHVGNNKPGVPFPEVSTFHVRQCSVKEYGLKMQQKWFIGSATLVKSTGIKRGRWRKMRVPLNLPTLNSLNVGICKFEWVLKWNFKQKFTWTSWPK